MKLKDKQGYANPAFAVCVMILGIAFFLSIAFSNDHKKNFYTINMEVAYISPDTEECILYDYKNNIMYTKTLSRRDADVHKHLIYTVRMHTNKTPTDTTDDYVYRIESISGWFTHPAITPTPSPVPTLSPDEIQEIAIQREIEYQELLNQAIENYLNPEPTDNSVKNSRIPTR